MLGLPIILAHETEEWVRPGGSLPFCNQRLLGSDLPTWPLTERDGFQVNVTLGWGTAIAAAAFWRRGAQPAAVVLWMELGNVALHAGMAARERRYNFGLVTAVALIAVHAAAGARALHRSDGSAGAEAAAAFALGLAIDAGLPVTVRGRMSRSRDRRSAAAVTR